MKYITSFFILITILCNATAYDLVVGTNTFHYVFEDTTLSTQIKNRILNNIEVMQCHWTNREVVFFQENASKIYHANGEVLFDDIGTQPIFYEGTEMHRLSFNTNNIGKLEILLSKKQTDIYTNAFAFVDDHLDAWNEVTNFYAYFANNALTNLPAGGLMDIFFHPNLTAENSILMHDEFISDLLTYDYHMPNQLGMREFPKNFLDYPEKTLWLALPVTSKKGEGRFNTKWHDVIYCVWRNGHWYLWANRWAGM